VSRLIGVYGSLREGGSNHHRLHSNAAPAVPYGVVRIPGRLYSLGSYSCAVQLANGEDGAITTEIYEVDDATFQALDAMEHEYGYVGIDTAVADSEGTRRAVIVWYLENVPSGATRVESGDWVAFCRSRQQPY
jgi:gamma-glutamylcyclotransferase (GGCT)/AIG2-like uncharacterized protein YtfP